MDKIKKIFKLENILVLTLIFVALLGIFGIPQILGVTSEQIVLLLIGVLALDMLIERLGYLDRIENKLSELSNKLQPQIAIDSIFLPRERIGSFEDLWINGDDIWIAGRTLHSFMRYYAVSVQKAAQNGKRFRFLLVNPDNHQAVVAIANTRVENDAFFLEAEMQEALSLMRQIQSKVPKDTIEIKLVDFIPSNMFRIVDPTKATGEMIIERFDYKVSTGQRRNFFVNKKRDPQTFSFYLDQFEEMWNDGISV